MTGGLGVPSSNLGAPTKNHRIEFRDAVRRRAALAVVERPPNGAASSPLLKRLRSVVGIVGVVVGVDFSLLSGEDTRGDLRIRLVVLFLRGLHRI
jgi:hypothetical protein